MGASQINPQAILAMLKARAGGAGAAGGATGAPSGGAEESVGPATNQLQGADPEYALKMISSLKKQIADMIPTLAFRAPAASRALVSTFKGIDAAIKELQQAQATLNAVGGPIKMSGIPSSQPPGGAVGPEMIRPASQGM